MGEELIGKIGIERQSDFILDQEMDITEAVRHSPILSRLVEEVRNEQAVNLQSYNRMHNRHNRSR